MGITQIRTTTGTSRRWWRAPVAVMVAVVVPAVVVASCAAPALPPDPVVPAPGPVDVAAEPPRNPFLAESPWPIAHRNSYQQDSTDLPGPTSPAPTVVDRIPASPGAITLAYGPAYGDGSFPVWGSAWFGVYKSVATPSGLRKVDEYPIIPDLSGGILNALSSAYALVDRDGTFFAAGQRSVRAFTDAVPGDPASGIAVRNEFTVPDAVMAPGDVIGGMNLTYDGHLVLVTKRGTMIAVDRGLTTSSALTLPFGEEVSNSIATDEDGGVYVVTKDHMSRVQWTGTHLSLDPADGAWSTTYDGGPDIPAPGRLGPGSGTTPTLIGWGSDDRLVAIADGAGLMSIDLFWRGPIPTDFTPLPGRDPRLAASVPITFGDPAATRSVTEQSFTARGWGVMAVNNAYGPPFDQATSSGTLAVLFSGVPAVAPHGAQKFVWDPATNTLSSSWANTTVSCPNGIPAMSAASGLAYCWGARDGSWTLEAIDWMTGSTVFRRVLSGEVVDNSAYAGTEVGAFGTVVSGTLGGLTAVRPGP